MWVVFVVLHGTEEFRDDWDQNVRLGQDGTNYKLNENSETLTASSIGGSAKFQINGKGFAKFRA
jgi:hypothetical protein